MNLSGLQWIAVVVLDVCVRAGVLFLTSFNILLVIISVLLSLAHLTVLVLANYVVSDLRLTSRLTAVLILFITNTIFGIGFVASWLQLIKSGRQTSCIGIEPKCHWVGGEITSFGVQTIAYNSLVQVSVNVAVVLIVCAFASCRSNRHERLT
jgi:hypothetical protein